MQSRIELNQDKQAAIEKEKRQEKQKKIVKIIVKMLIFIFVFIFLLCLYVTKISTVGLIVREEFITSEKLPKSFHGLKIVQFSDLHYEDETLLKKVVSAINLRKPDLIFFTGDLLAEEEISTDQRQALSKELKKLKADIGKYAVLGEADNEIAISILTDCGFQILDDNYDLIYKESVNPILVVGINTNHTTINYNQALAYYQIPEHNESIFSIALLHEPDTIDELLSKHSVDVAMAGHSHLGEVRIPGLISLAQKEGAKKYQNDYYELDQTKFYISSGIGTSEFPYRFFARPSITYLRLTTKS